MIIRAKSYPRARLAQSAESDELCIPAGLQDSVIQVYEGLVYMDFDRLRFRRLPREPAARSQ